MDAKQIEAAITGTVLFVWTMLWVTVGAVFTDGSSFWPAGLWVSMPMSWMVYKMIRHS